MTRDEARKHLTGLRSVLDVGHHPISLGRSDLRAILTLLLADDGTRAALASVFVDDTDPSEAA